MGSRICNASKKKPPRNAYEKVLEMSNAGLSILAIARGLGVSIDLFRVWREQYPELQDAIDEGRENEHTMLRTSLIEAAHGGNVAAAMFLLKTRHGYREGDQQGVVNKVSVTFELPGPKSVEDYSRVIEGEYSGKD